MPKQEEAPLPTCPECGCSMKPRTNKKFCGPECRSKHHGRLAKQLLDQHREGASNG